MRNINTNNGFSGLPLNPYVEIKNSNMYRGKRVSSNNDEFNINVDFRFEIASIKLGVKVESISKSSDDVVTFYGAYQFDCGSWDNTLMGSKRILNCSDVEDTEVSLISDYLRHCEGPSYKNTFNYNLDTNKIHNLFSVSLDHFLGFNSSVSYGYTNNEINGVKDSNYIQFDIDYQISNYDVCGSFVKQLEANEDEFIQYGLAYSKN